MVVFAAPEQVSRMSEIFAEHGERLCSVGKAVPGARRVRIDRPEKTLPA
jgi:hypothetical protein